MPKPQIIASDSNRLTIRVWLANLSDGCVGHASLQTYGPHGVYASFWPNEDSKSQKSFSGVFAAHMHSPQDDEKNEERPPDVVIHLYSLRIDLINQHYRAFRTSNSNWSLWGSSFFRDENTRNCSGLTSFLLSKGEIEKLINIWDVHGEGIANSSIGGASIFAGGLLFFGAGIRFLISRVGMPRGAPSTDTNALLGTLLGGGILIYGTYQTIKGTVQTTRTFIATTPDDIARIAQAAYTAEREMYDIVISPNHQSNETGKDTPIKVCTIV